MQKFLIAGLGNPGQKYHNTRHNIGFRIIDSLAQELNLSFKKETKGPHYLVAQTLFQGKKVFFIKPLEFMNKSGGPISKVLNYFDIPTQHLLVIHDDLDIEFGRIKLTRNGGHGGHNGVRSIIAALNTKDFPRLKVGIGRPPNKMPPERYVLANFKKEDTEKVNQIIERSKDATLFFLQYGIEAAMNEFNAQKIAF